MPFFSYYQLKTLEVEVLFEELILAKRRLFELRIKHSVRQVTKSHISLHLKRRIAQILLLLTEKNQTVNHAL